MDWLVFPVYDIIYCDPPWGQKMVKFFETMMKKAGQNTPLYTITELINKLGCCSDKSKPIFIEYSKKGYETVVSIMQDNGHKLSAVVHSTQSNGRPYVILVFNTGGYFPKGSNIGFEIITEICNNLNFESVFDPFAGIGKTATVFIRSGKTYLGSEINTSRFNKLEKALWDGQQ